MENLDRDEPIQPRVPRPVNFPHPPAPRADRILYGPSFVTEVSAIGGGAIIVCGRRLGGGFDDSVRLVGYPEIKDLQQVSDVSG